MDNPLDPVLYCYKDIQRELRPILTTLNLRQSSSWRLSYADARSTNELPRSARVYGKTFVLTFNSMYELIILLAHLYCNQSLLCFFSY